MPTLNPRINVTLAFPVRNGRGAGKTSARVSLHGPPRAARSLRACPFQVVAMLKAAADMGDAARQRLQQDMGETITNLESKSQQALALAAGVTADLVAQAEAIRAGGLPGNRHASGARAGCLAGVRRRWSITSGLDDPPPLIGGSSHYTQLQKP